MSKNYFTPVVLSLFLAAATGCADYIDAPQTPEQTGKLITLTAGIPDDDPTRVAYDDGTRQLTWEKGDQIKVTGYNEAGGKIASQIFTLSSGAGGTTGQFTGEAIPGAAKYAISYPADDAGMTQQTQTGNGSTAHLRKSIRLGAWITDLSQAFTFEMESSIMKFDLSGIPTEIGALKKLEMEVEYDLGTDSRTLLLSETTLSNNKLTAYMSFNPGDIGGINPNGVFTVSLTGTGGTWKAEATASDQGKKYEARHRYTATLEEFKRVDYVDLGLPSGVKWADRNLGASKPSEYGDYYAWGETEPKTDYSWETYTLRDTEGNMKKYNATDGKTTLEAEDDAATAKLGTPWRMPTSAEIEELLNSDNCTWTWITQDDVNGYGVNGYKVVSKKNGNSIFLPAAGYRSGSELRGAGSWGNYWSSSLNAAGSDYARYLYFLSDVRDWSQDFRYYGLPIRPVRP